MKDLGSAGRGGLVSNEDWSGELHRMVLERNQRETRPFASLFASQALLYRQSTQLRQQVASLTQQITILKHQQGDIDASGSLSSSAGKGSISARQHNVVVAQVAKLKEQLHQTQAELATKYKAQADQAEGALALTQQHESMRLELEQNKATLTEVRQALTTKTEVAAAMDNTVHMRESEMAVLREELGRMREILAASESEVEKLAASNRQITGRIVAEKQRTIEELNRMNDLVEAFKQGGAAATGVTKGKNSQTAAAAAALQRAIGGLTAGANN